ncbi:MAG: HigA family addiction module antitoxin [Candidatus Tumulicola sp.]
MPNIKISPTHPGDVLREDFMAPMNLSANRLAMDIRVSVSRITEIVNGHRSVTAETALRLARYFGVSPEFWIRLQGKYDLAKAEDDKAGAIEREVLPRMTA